MTHKTGPWMVEIMRDGGGHKMLNVVKEIDRGAWQEICRSYDTDNESLANACPIAAAPELLEACEKLLGAIECWIANPEDVVANARATIAKAKGEEPK